MPIKEGNMLEPLEVNSEAEGGLFPRQNSSALHLMPKDGSLPSEDEWPFINHDWSVDERLKRMDSPVVGTSVNSSKTDSFLLSLPNSAEGARPEFPEERLCNVDTLHRSSPSFSFSHRRELPIRNPSIGQSADICNSYSNSEDADHSLEDLKLQGILDLLSDNEEESFKLTLGDLETNFPQNLEENEDYDIFGSGGGMELDGEPHSYRRTCNLGLQSPIGKSRAQPGSPKGTMSIAGEHPLGERPSRTLFVRNINSSVEDDELRALFEQYGTIRSMYTSCKYRGFVMISYYDIRAALSAMHALQNKSLQKRKLDIHFSVPKAKLSAKDVNQGIVAILNLDRAIPNEELLRIFGFYGEVKEISAAPDKHYHRFIEYYDIRAAEAALKALNRKYIGGKRIKLEPVHPANIRHSLMPQLSQDMDREKGLSSSVQRFSPRLPCGDSPQGHFFRWGSMKNSGETSSALNRSRLEGHQKINSPESAFGIASIHPHVSSPNQGIGDCVGKRIPARFPGEQFDHANDLLCCSSHSVGSSTSPNFLWGGSRSIQRSLQGSQTAYQQSVPTLPSAVRSTWDLNSFSRLSRHLASSYSHHVGSTSGGTSLIEFMHQYPGSTSDLSSLLGPVSLVGTGGIHPSNSGLTEHVNCLYQNRYESADNLLPSLTAGIFHPQLREEIYSKVGIPSSLDRLSSHTQFYTGDNCSYIADSKKRFQLDLDQIASGKDNRTTLMIKNIPNKYTSQMLLAVIDEKHKETYDFLYLPIDFKNKCNVGYAFINMTSPSLIIPFYQAFNGKRWEKFNSEKVASIAYARIQGRAALIAHFQNSSLMNEDESCRPILFFPDVTETSFQEPIPVGFNMRIHSRKDYYSDTDIGQENSRAATSKDVSLPTEAECDSGTPLTDIQTLHRGKYKHLDW